MFTEQYQLMNSINFITVILVKGRLYSKVYDGNDLSYFFDNFIEEEQQNINILISEIELTT